MFALKQHHKWGIDEVENLLPFERDLYVKWLVQHLKELKEAAERANQ